ncbi:MAG: phospholipase D-like domain-containing protein [Pseudomonadota bacterium]
MAIRSHTRLWTENILRLLISLLLFFSFVTSFAKTSLETLPHHGDQSIISELESAQNTLQITMYGFTDKKIAATLIKKQSQGVNVQLLIENEPYKASGENTQIIRQLKNAGIIIHNNSSTFSLTHQKTILIDQKRAMILTGNFTYSGVYHQRNFIITTDDTNVVKNLTELFEADWNQTHYFPAKNTAFITSPENSWQTLNQLINNTYQTLDIYALEVNDKRIIHALLKKNIKTRILISHSTRVIDKARLCQHRIAIHRLTKLDQHAKALLKDYGLNNALAYVGSANLTYSSLSKNREVGMLFSDKVALKKLNATFEKDWKNSISIC